MLRIKMQRSLFLLNKKYNKNFSEKLSEKSNKKLSKKLSEKFSEIFSKRNTIHIIFLFIVRVLSPFYSFFIYKKILINLL